MFAEFLTRLVIGEQSGPVVGRLRWADLRQLTVRNLLQAARIQWSWSYTSSLLVGAAVAWKDGSLHPTLLIWTWVGIELIHAGTCMTNDYWDHRSGADDVGEHTMFNAGSRVIQEGKIDPSLLLVLSFVCYGLGAATGIVLALARGWPILALGLAGGLLGYSYTAPPAKLCYRGLDQVAIILLCGPLMILGSYYVQAQRFTPEVVLISIVYGITASMILYIKGFQDTRFDRRAGKESIVIKLGQDRAAAWFIYFFLAAYLMIAVGIVLKILPFWMVVAAGSFPIVLRAQRGLRDHLAGGNIKTFSGALMKTMSVHLYLGLLVIIGYVVMAAIG